MCVSCKEGMNTCVCVCGQCNTCVSPELINTGGWGEQGFNMCACAVDQGMNVCMGSLH